MSSDDEELAALRAARVARGRGLTVVRTREKEKKRVDVFRCFAGIRTFSVHHAHTLRFSLFRNNNPRYGLTNRLLSGRWQ